jgi:Reverse transcriptase (RNA-dependent DNA polymerase)
MCFAIGYNQYTEQAENLHVTARSTEVATQLHAPSRTRRRAASSAAAPAGQRLAQARQHSGSILQQIERHRVAGRHRQARRTQRLLLRSYDAASAALDEANKRRQIRHRLSDGQVLMEARTLNPWRLEPGLVHVEALKKSNGGYRPLTKMGIRRKALSVLAARAMRPFIDPEPRLYATKKRGRKAAAEAVRDAFAEGYTWAVIADIRDFFSSLDHDRLRRVLPLPGAVLDQVVLPDRWDIDFNSVWERNEHEIDQIVETIRVQIEPEYPSLSSPHYISEGMVLLAWASRGIPQGAPASAVVAELVSSSIARAMPADARVCVYADDIMILSRTRVEARSNAEHLQGALRAGPAGPFTISRATIRHASWGFDWLGFRFRKRCGRVIVCPSSKNWERFHVRFWDRLQAVRAGADAVRGVGSARVEQSLTAAARVYLGGDHLAPGASRRLDPVVSVCQPEGLAILEDHDWREADAGLHGLGVLRHRLAAQRDARPHVHS